MSGKHCRLYDENLVHNIMVATGLSIMEYLRDNRDASTDEVCDFIEVNAPHIIENTIEHLNEIEGSDKDEKNDNPWSTDDEEPRE